MTNTQQMAIDQTAATGKGLRQVKGYAETNLLVVRARITELQAEAAGERLAALGRGPGRGGVRHNIGRMMIRAGYRVAGESGPAGRATSRPARPFAA